MERDGIIEQRASPWKSGVTTAKCDYTARCYVDHRSTLNKRLVTVAVQYDFDILSCSALQVRRSREGSFDTQCTLYPDQDEVSHYGGTNASR